MPDFSLIDVFDRNLCENGDDGYPKRQRFQTISKKIIHFQKTHRLISDFVDTGFINLSLHFDLRTNWSFKFIFQRHHHFKEISTQ
jgi:hypothetical protein